MMLKEREVDEMNEHGKCITCKADWSLYTEMERYCKLCKTRIVIIQDEVYFDKGW